MDCRHRGVLSLPHNPGEKNGGHRRSHIVRHFAVVGSKGVRPGAQRMFVCNVRFDEQLVEKQAMEEGALKKKNSSYIGKFRVEQLLSHI
jgi:hypothetical protein